MSDIQTIIFYILFALSLFAYYRFLKDLVAEFSQMSVSRKILNVIAAIIFLPTAYFLAIPGMLVLLSIFYVGIGMIT